MKIEHDKSGKVNAVVYADADGNLQKQMARVVCVAGNSIETPRLLLNSESSKHPDGLANSSGQVGRNYMRHMTGSVYATFDEPVHMWRGTTMAGIITDEARHDPARGFVGGYEMETLSLGLPFMAAFLDPGGWGRDFCRAMDNYANMAGMWLVGEDMPQESNRITAHASEKDQFGMPVPNVHFDDHPNDIAMREHAFGQGRAIYEAAGANQYLSGAAIPVDAQPRHLPDECESGGWRGQRKWAGPRYRQPVHIGRQSVHHRRVGKSNADHRHPCHSAGGLYCQANVDEGDLRSRTDRWNRIGEGSGKFAWPGDFDRGFAQVHRKLSRAGAATGVKVQKMYN